MHGRRFRGRTLAATMSVLLVVGMSSLVALPGAAAPVSGAASPAAAGPTTLYTEDFENGTGTGQTLLNAYTGAAPAAETYTADPAWLAHCNGEIVEFDTPYTDLGNCVNIVDTANTRQLAYALGEQGGSSAPAANHAVTAYTENNPGANSVEFATAKPISLASANGRFLDFGVDAAAVNCNASAPKYQFSLLNGSTATPVGGQINACTSTTTVNVPAVGTMPAKAVNVGSYTSNGSVLFTGSAVGLRMTNANGSGVGNDAAFDNIKILDVTPTLDKAFSPTSIQAGGSSTLTFTITNTSELAAKNGWSFTDTLPSGLTVTAPAAATTCPSGSVTAPAGGTSVKVSGNLNAGMKSCTVTVHVTGSKAGSYTNGPDNVTETGLNPPQDATLTITQPPAWTCDTYGYLFQSPNIQDPPHDIYRVDLVSGASSVLGTTPDNVNAVGYNTTDNYVYGWDARTSTVVRVAADGSLTDLGVPSGVNAASGYNVGDFDKSGHYWMENSATGQWYEIDFSDPNSASYGTVMASGTTNTPATVAQLPSDWAFVGGAFYGATNTPSGTGPAHLVKFDPTTHASTDLGLLPGTDNSPYGAAYADAEGNLYVSDNTTGHIFRIKPQTRATIKVSNGPPSGNNDGERCSNAPIPTITVKKSVAGRVQDADQFTVGLDNSGGTTLTSATTTGTDTTATTDDWPVSANTNYTITDAMAAGSPDALTAYVATIDCADTTSGASVPTTGDGPKWTVKSTDADPITCTVTNTPGKPAFTVTKAASPSGAVHPGDTVTYTVTVRNTSAVPYTAANPASFTDDLSKVLDDATYNNDATDGAKVSGTTLSWSGPLAVGASKTITYSVTVNEPDTGDHDLKNAVTPQNGGTCATAADCSTDTPVQSFSVVKTTKATAVDPGEKVTYTVTVTNTGTVDYTANDPASFTDDLSKVLDDATYDNDATGGATYKEPTLSWSGALAAGKSVTITYSVTVNDPDTGDKHLDNAVVTPPNSGGNCSTGSPDPGCQADIPSRSFTVVKTASQSTVHPGDKITYTVTVTNTGQSDYTNDSPASFTDNLSKVLDDATYDNDASNGATYKAPVISWSGPLAVGKSVKITYSVTVNDPDAGDHDISNAVVPGTGGKCGKASDCTTETKVQSFSVKKSTTATKVTAGEKVTYSIVVTNTGQVDYTTDNPASFTDDLSKVLDDAAYDNDATNGATYDKPVLSWSGPLAVGKSVTITYSVTVNNPETGDKHLNNAVVTPPNAGGDCPEGSTNPDCQANVPGKSLMVTKKASSADATPGSKITYTITVTNTGQTDYTAGDPASFTDDLSKVLDDAAYDNDATNGATYKKPVLSWSGPLAVGKSVKITYSVTVNNPDKGDRLLDNTVVTPANEGGNCTSGSTDPACTTRTGVRSYSVKKTASSGSAKPGDKITYTITVTNTGQTAYTTASPASFTDDLSKVLDDATYNNDADNGATYKAGMLSWSGPLAVGKSVTITYSVTVNDPDRGDGSLWNAVVTPPNDGGTMAGGDCPRGSPNPDCSTTTTIAAAPAPPLQSINTGNAGAESGTPTADLLGILGAILIACGMVGMRLRRRAGN